MSKSNPKSSVLSNLPLLATGVLFLISLYLLVLKIIRPAFIYIEQMPVFVPARHAIHEALSVPGGLIDFISSGFMLYFTREKTGALILAFFSGLILLVIFSLLRNRTLFKEFWALPFLPVMALATMLTHYDRPLADTISLVPALGFFWIARQFNNKPLAIRLALITGLGLLLYYLTPGGFLLYIALIFVAQIPSLISHRINIIVMAGAGALAWVIPTLAYQRIFLISKKEAFLTHLPLMQSEPAFMPFFLFVILLLGSVVLASIHAELKGAKENRILSHPLGMIAQIILIPLFTGLLVFSHVNRIDRKILEIRYLAHENRWRDVLGAADINAFRHITCMTLINQALYHTNQLASNMFAYPQAWHKSGLILPRDVAYQYPLDHSHIIFDMAHVAEAERWASEALVLYGQTPWVLKDLALINILQEDWTVADKYLQVLDLIGPARKWAASCREMLHNPEKLRHQYSLQQLKNLRPVKNFVTNINNPQMDFEALFSQNPENKMAYEYMMAYFLLSRDIRRFMKFLPKYTDYHDRQMPKHYQEALLVYQAQKGEIDLPGFQPDSRIVQRFNQFGQAVKQIKSLGNAGIQQIRGQFGDTYWYYLIYSQIEGE